MRLQTLRNQTAIQLQKSCFLAVVVVILTTALVGCRTTKTPDVPPREEQSLNDVGETAPWRRGVLNADAVPHVYLDQWQHAENRASCALIAPAELGEGKGAAVRSAYFGGGWGVAYDAPDLRSAFGVAGTGADAAGPSYDEWPFKKEWPDGSSIGYGPEGGSGPNQLAYLRIPDQDCLYNVWSRLGVGHLEALIEQLRFVKTGD